MSEFGAVILDLVESKKLSIAALRFIFLRKNQFKRTSLNRPLLFSCPLGRQIREKGFRALSSVIPLLDHPGYMTKHTMPNTRSFTTGLLLLFFFYSYSIQAQSPYELTWKKDISLMLGGGVGASTAYLIGNNVATLSLDEIQNLDVADINSFDRSATRNWSLNAGKASDFLMYGAALLPISLLFDEEIRHNYKHVGVILGESLFLTAGLTGITKVIAKRTRPFVYNDEAPSDEKTTKSARLSFFSGHTSTVAVLSFCTAKIYMDHHPDSKLKPVIWTLAATLPAATGYLRYKAGKHYPSDVIIGYGVGALAGILIPLVHKRKGGRKLSISPNSSNDSIGFTFRCRL